MISIELIMFVFGAIIAFMVVVVFLIVIKRLKNLIRKNDQLGLNQVVRSAEDVPLVVSGFTKMTWRFRFFFYYLRQDSKMHSMMPGSDIKLTEKQLLERAWLKLRYWTDKRFPAGMEYYRPYKAIDIFRLALLVILPIFMVFVVVSGLRGWELAIIGLLVGGTWLGTVIHWPFTFLKK